VHIRSVEAGPWIALVDDCGRALPGVRGRAGVSAVRGTGAALGADLVEMQPGSSFPLHTHPGDHILYIVEGSGFVHVDGVDHEMRRGDTIFVPAEYPHGVRTRPDASGPLVFLAVGHPHRPLDSRDRMRVVGKERSID
jgi:quercetin dioxygenase-like cupin family protein